LNNISKQEETIYNCYLKHLRKGQPYQPRKDFSKLTPNNVTSLRKLSYFFSKFKHISYDDFFGAPNILHPDEKCPPLEFFTTRAAIKAYTLSFKKKQDESPEKQLDQIKESLHFIAMFCLKNKINLDQYINYNIKGMPIWMQHYREHHVNPYTLLEFGDLNKFANIEEDKRILWSNDFFDKIDAYKTRYHNSLKTKTLVKEGFKKIKEFLKKELQTI
jgi:hypothetical protein